MSQVIKLGEEVKKCNGVLGVFIDYFQMIGAKTVNEEQLFDGRAIVGFLKLIQDMSPLIGNQGLDKENYPSRIILFKKILNIMENYSCQVLKTEHLKIDLNLYEICMQQKQSQLVKLLIVIFKLAVQANNKSFFIEAVMQMDSKSQQILAEFLKKDIQFFEQYSPIKEDFENIQIRGREFRVKDGDFQLIDKIYEYEQENQKLTHVIEQLQSENHLIEENIHSLQKKCEALKDENEEYKLLIIDYEEALMRMKSKEGDHSMEKHQENQNYEQLNKLIKQSNERNQILKIQHEAERKKYQRKINDLDEIVRSQKEKNKIMSRSHEIIKEQLQQVITRCKQMDEKIQDQNQLMKTLRDKNLSLEDRAATLTFQLNYKDSQIQELKQSVMNTSNLTNRQDENQCRKSILFTNFNSPPMSPRSMLKLDIEQLKTLRLQVKELNKEISSLNGMKTKNKELEYQKKKLMKILREYEASRGEQNQILNGCLYELRIKYKQFRNLQKQDSTNDGKSTN